MLSQRIGGLAQNQGYSADVQQLLNALHQLVTLGVGTSGGAGGTAKGRGAATIGAQLMQLLEQKMASGAASAEERNLHEEIRSRRGAGHFESLEWIVPTLITAGILTTASPAAAGGTGGASGAAGAGGAGAAGAAGSGGASYAGWLTGAEEAAAISTSGLGAAAAGGGFWSSEAGRRLIGTGMGFAVDKLSGDPSKRLREQSTAPFESGELQRFLPPSLREVETGDILRSGVQGIGDLVRRPGSLSPTVSEAILPRLAAESERIGQNFRNIGSQQAGAASRANVPVSIQGALERALDVAQERAQRGARREALTDSEGLRRQDLDRTFALLDSILQFQQSRQGGAITGLGAASTASQNRQASNLAFLGNIFQPQQNQAG